MFRVEEGCNMFWQITIRRRLVYPQKVWGLALVAIGSLVLQPCWAANNYQPNEQSLRQKQELQESIARINAEQAQEVQSSSAQTGEAIMSRNLEAKRILQDMKKRDQDDLTAMREAGYYAPDGDGGSVWIPAYTPQEIAAESRRMQNEETKYQTSDHGQAQMAVSNLQRSNELATVATNLESQLETDQSKRGFKLSPVGTNLYVRNYQFAGTGDEDDQNSAQAPVGSPGSPLALPASRASGGSRSSQTPLVTQQGRLSNGYQKSSKGISQRSAGKSGRVVQTVTGQYLKP
jgi:hypothetical protein